MLMSRKGGYPVQFVADKRTQDTVNRTEARSGFTQMFGSGGTPTVPCGQQPPCAPQPQQQQPSEDQPSGNTSAQYSVGAPYCCEERPEKVVEMRLPDGRVVRLTQVEINRLAAPQPALPEYTPSHNGMYVVSAPTTREITWRWRFTLSEAVANEAFLKCSLGKHSELLSDGSCGVVKGVVVTRVSVVDVRSDCICDLACNAEWIRSRIAFDCNGTVANLFVRNGAITYPNPADATLYRMDECAFERLRWIIDLKDMDAEAVCAAKRLEDGAVLVEANSPLYMACVKQQLFTDEELDHMHCHASEIGAAGLVLSPQDYIRVHEMVSNDIALMSHVNDDLDLTLTLKIAPSGHSEVRDPKPAQIVESVLRSVYDAGAKEAHLRKTNNVSVTMRVDYAVVTKRAVNC